MCIARLGRGSKPLPGWFGELISTVRCSINGPIQPTIRSSTYRFECLGQFILYWSARHQLAISSSSAHHQLIISSLSVHRQLIICLSQFIIRSSCANHLLTISSSQLIIQSSPAHHLLIISSSSAHHPLIISLKLIMIESVRRLTLEVASEGSQQIT